MPWDEDLCIQRALGSDNAPPRADVFDRLELRPDRAFNADLGGLDWELNQDSCQSWATR